MIKKYKEVSIDKYVKFDDTGDVENFITQFCYIEKELKDKDMVSLVESVTVATMNKWI